MEGGLLLLYAPHRFKPRLAVSSLRFDILFHWLTNTPDLLQRACVVVVVTYLAIRLEWFRRAMRGVDKTWRCRLIAALFFGALAIFGTFNGIILDIATLETATFPHNQATAFLQDRQAILSFRDMLVMAAGLTAGPWVGFAAGLIAGLQRYQLGGFVAFASGLATVCIGGLSGLARQLWPGAVRPRGTLILVLLLSGWQKLMVVFLSQPHIVALAVIQETIIPETTVNCFGCLLFLSVWQDLERERLQTQAQQAELRALQAQVEPHFVNNTLNAIKALISRDPEQAAAYVVKLARFFDATRLTAKANSLPLGEELAHLQNYLDFQQLRFPGAFSFRHSIADELLPCLIPPRSLLTLAENALLHGRRGLTGVLEISIACAAVGNTLLLCVRDNGCGLSGRDLNTLGKQPIDSERGSGNGLYQLSEGLQLAFDGAAKLVVADREGGGCEVTLIVPKRTLPW